ncbi:MAG: hypothetical protein K2N74_03410 [Clostridiales bacterium]|nr:hypothetical protein [Clostridiales bacterium]
MAKYFETKKWKKRALAVLSVALSGALSMGILAACASEEPDEEPEEAVAKTDTQLIKNGDFEFYGEMTKELGDKRSLINTPTSWSFTSGSPSSDTKSGLINVAQDEWDSLTKSSFSLISADGTANADAISYGYAHWEEASIYDRLQFVDKYSTAIGELSSSSDESKLFNKYSYSIDFEDVENLRGELGDKVALHDSEKTDTGLLMIHNSRTSDGVRGTAQYYTSSTTVTLKAGTAAELSVWVKTSHLYHYYANNVTDSKTEEGKEVTEGTEVTQRAGAYIGVTNTVGGTTLDQMQIKNINTRNVTENNGWQEYKLFIRANTFASTTFRIVLGLGQGSSDNRYEAVDGYALFDDLSCKIIPDSEYLTKTADIANKCTLDSKADDKKFDATKLEATSYALDLHADFDELKFDEVTFGLTEETSGNNKYTSEKIDGSLNNNAGNGKEDSLTKATEYSGLSALATQNGYFKNIYENDFKNFPFGTDKQVVLLLSTNGAAYTATLPEITVAENTRILVSFFVKTSKIMNGRTGASATLIDGENKTAISAFDSTTIDTVDIDDTTEDIYDGWVQCFFFVSNDTDEAKKFHLELSYGPTTIVGTDVHDYGQGYAAFTNFQTRELTKTQLSYASSGSQAVKTSLTSSVEDNSRFDGVSATSDIKTGLARPASFTGVVSGSKFLVNGSNVENELPENVYAGLLNSEYADTYKEGSEAWKTKLNTIAGSATDWWGGIFGDSENPSKVARQPLVIMNTGSSAAPAYGFFEQNQTIASNSYQRISMRVKVSKGAKAYLYLIDTSDITENDKLLSPALPSVTYWYDDDGNIVKNDPKDSKFNAKTDVLFYLQDNGLYKSADSSDNNFYANLHNYEVKDGNLVTADETVAFYGHEGVYYTTEAYTQEVKNLPTEHARYEYDKSDLPATVICVEGTEKNAGQWVEVSFYIHTGSNSKSYRLEVWAGERNDYTKTEADGKITVTSGNGKGIPAGGYVFFDNYASASTSNYDALLKIAADEIRAELNQGKSAGDEGYIGAKDNLPEDYALYYTFTFYDANTFLRYDVNEDEDNVGNRYASYEQSAQSEKTVYLLFNDASGKMTGTPSCSFFLDYEAIETTVTPDALDSDTDDDTDDDTDNDINVGDILLIVSSSLLAVVLLAVIVVLIVRHVWAKRGKKVKPAKPAKDKRVKPKKEKKEEESPLPEDKNDPYNE